MNKAQAQQLDDEPKGSWIPCPDCDGIGYFEQTCSCSPDPKGCSDCGHRGWIPRICSTCKGGKEIFVNVDTGLECFEDYSTIEGMKMVSNYQIRKEGICT